MSTAAADKVLVLIRHAKAEQSFSLPDVDRELTGRGRRDARVAGAWLHDHGYAADHALVSPSHRTRQTWEELQAGGVVTAFTAYPDVLYSGATSRVLELLRETEESATTVFVVGHAPVMPDLASLLTDGQGSRRAHDALAGGFPTAGIAVVGYSGHWSTLGAGTCDLDRFHVARAADPS